MGYIVLIIILVITLYLFKNDRKSRINSYIPGPFKLPLVGNALSMGGDLHLQLFKWYKQYGDIYYIRMGYHDTVVLTGFSTIKKAFIDNGEIFEKRYRMKSRLVLNGGEDIGMENGEKHKILRNVVLSEMTTVRIKRMEYHLIEESEKLIKLLDQHADDGKEFEINGYLHMFALNVTLRFLFGVDYPYDKVSQTEGIIESIGEFFIVLGNPIISDLFKFIKGPNSNHPFFVSYAKMVKHVESLIEKYQKEKEKEKQSGSYTQDNETIIGKLIQEYEKGSISWKAVVETAIDVVAGGADTSANTIIFCIVNLINNQSIQLKLYSNISSSIQTSSSNDIVITQSKYNLSIPYLTMVLKETMRMYPIATFGVPHENSEDVEINGYTIAAGTQIIQNIYASHRSDEFFNSPNEFIPERFIESSNLMYGSQNQLLQFGCGSRLCPGKNLSLASLFTLLATLCNRYEFINPNPSVTLSDIGKFGIALQPPLTKLIIKKRLNK